MKIFYVKIDDFKKEHDKGFLMPYADKKFGTEKRFFEYTIGRYITKKAAEEFYNIKNTEIIINSNGKPSFKNGDIHFNISHSCNIVAVCFDKFPLGFDIEYIKERDLKKLSNHYNKNFESLDDFYKFWTLKEAEYKLSSTAKTVYTNKFEDEYYISIASSSNKNFETEIFAY